MRYSKSIYSTLLGAVLGLLAAGCGGQKPEGPPKTAPSVMVSYPVEREVTDYADYTGRTAAVDSVEVRARVWGYVEKVNFKEGALVKKGDVLFEIDPRTYQATLAQAEGNLASGRANFARLESELRRAEELIKKQTIAQQEYEKAIFDRDQAAASIVTLKGAVDQATLDFNFTKVVAPISGRVSRALVTKGNLISSGPTGGTMLTSIVSVDPIYAYFDVDERTVQHVRKLIREGKAKSVRDAEISIALGLATETGHPHKGVIDFVDNHVTPKTGTLKLRGLFANKHETLSPGFFVRVRVPIGQSHPAMLISDRAIDNDQGQKIVFVVNDKNEVVARPVRLGALHDGLRVIEEGLKPGERVIVNGLQQVRPGVVVEPKVVDMPKKLPS